MINLLKKFWNTLVLKTEEAQCQFFTLGVIVIFGYAGWYFLWHNVNVQPYENLALRLIGSFLGIPLILWKYWPQKLKKLIPLYWYLSLLYLLPFFFSFMFFKNNGSIIWQLNGITALVLLILLTDWISLILLTCIGVTLGWFFYILTTAEPSVPTNLIPVVSNYLTMMLLFSLFIRNKSKAQKEQLKTLRSISASMAHELRTPLRAISFSLANIKQQLPHLERPDTENKDVLENIHISVDDADSELKSTFTVIDMLLVKADLSSISRAKFKICSMEQCVQAAIHRYPFDIGQEKLVTWQGKDFAFIGDELLMIHIIFNLLKNALYYIKAAGKGCVKIWSEETEKTNNLHFYDNGQGMSPQTLSHVFDAFFSKTYHGTGVGLSFCKYVMQSFGGDITCSSKENEFTELVLSFPKIKPS